MYAPTVPGSYIAFFRFVHGDNQRFGQKVWCDVLVQQGAPVIMKESEPKEERSSLLNESMQHEEPIPQVEFNFEIVPKEQVAAQEVSSLQLEEPAADLAKSQIEEQPVVQEFKISEPIIVSEEPLKKSEASAEELERIRYLERLALV
jgi:hypothetical protein